MSWRTFGLLIVEILKISFVLFLIGGSYYFVGLMNLYDHEKIHEKIFDTYGIENNLTINYRSLEGNVTAESYKDCNDACLTQHRFNDIINYNADLVVQTGYALFICWLVVKLFYD